MGVFNHRLLMAASAIALTIWNGAAQASQGGEPAPVPALVTLEPMLVPIVEHGELIARLEVRAMWKAADGDGQAQAERRLPVLRAALIEAASDHARLVATPGQAVDPAPLAAQLSARAAKAGFTGELLVLEAVARPS